MFLRKPSIPLTEHTRQLAAAEWHLHTQLLTALHNVRHAPPALPPITVHSPLPDILAGSAQGLPAQIRLATAQALDILEAQWLPHDNLTPATWAVRSAETLYARLYELHWYWFDHFQHGQRLEQQQVRLHQDVARLQAELARATVQQTQLETTRAAYAQLQVEHDQLRQELAECRAALAAVNAENHGLKALVVAQQDELQALAR